MDPARIDACIDYVKAELQRLANPEKAAGMQAYMKTEMPFYGVQKPGRAGILKTVERDFAPDTQVEYEELVLALWSLPHREEKYIGLGVAVAHRRFHTPASLPLFRRLIVDGAWWDFVDEVATHLVRPVVIGFPVEGWADVDTWIVDEVMWLRRAAIICQVGAKEKTDVRRLFRFCRARMHEKEFFIRKAIGWALRDYARTDPAAVATFVAENRDLLSGLSFREATKHIGDLIPGSGNQEAAGG